MLAIDYAERFTNIPYIFGGSRFDASNGTDCSGLVTAAMYNAHGIDPTAFGTWTMPQWLDGDYTRCLHYGTTPDLPYEDMQRGDLIFTSNCSSDFSTGNGSHVGFYTGNPDAPFLSHFATPGARITAVNGVYGNECYYGVKRIICEDQEENDMLNDDDIARIWAYHYENDSDEWDCYTKLREASKFVQYHESVCAAGDGGDTRTRIDYIDQRVKELHDAMTAIYAKLDQIDENLKK